MRKQCLYKCKLDLTSGKCLGCGRTPREIKETGDMIRFSSQDKQYEEKGSNPVNGNGR
jgi:predicted Fe-S protein YdhL (DUF1289 family)